MTMMQIFRNSLLTIFFIANFLMSATYYVDAKNGNDTNNGTSEATAWKSLNKVNSMKYQPGDQILFKRGDSWTGQLIPSTSGTSSSRITYGAYGSGNKPVITLRQSVPGADKASNWVQSSSSVYYINLPFNLLSETRIWLGDKEYDWSTSGVSGVNSTFRWTVNSGRLYVYATSNPVSFYGSIKYPGYGSGNLSTVKISDKDYLTFQNIDFSGGYNTFSLNGADYIIIEDSNVGFGAHGRGITGNSTSGNSSSDPNSDNVIVRRNMMDSGWKVYTKQNREIMDGISIQNGASNWQVYENFFKNWDHAAVQVYGVLSGKPVNNTKIFKNKITAPDLAFARSFEVLSREPDLAMNTEIYQNHIYDITVRAQIGGYYTKIYYNIFENVKNSTAIYLSGKTAEGVNVATFGQGVAKDVKVHNNTFYGLDRSGLWSYIKNAEFVNNLIIDCGREYQGFGIRVTDNGAFNGTWKNNLVYSPGVSSSQAVVSWAYASKTISQFNALNGKDGNVISGNLQHTGSMAQLVKNAATSEFMPVQGSLAIDKGTDLGIKADFYGNPIVGKPDIGAIEYSNSTVLDQVPPQIDTVMAIGLDSVKIVFNEELSELEAEEISNFMIDNGIKILSSSLSENMNEVILKTSVHSEGRTYNVEINNIKDLAGNSIPEQTTASYDIAGGVTSAENEDNLQPEKFDLMQNYPNPFNPSTKIKFSVASQSMVSLKVFDMLGREVMTLVNEMKTPGQYEVQFDASNLSSGTYIYRIKADNFVSTKKMMLVK